MAEATSVKNAAVYHMPLTDDENYLTPTLGDISETPKKAL